MLGGGGQETTFLHFRRDKPLSIVFASTASLSLNRTASKDSSCLALYPFNLEKHLESSDPYERDDSGDFDEYPHAAFDDDEFH